MYVSIMPDLCLSRNTQEIIPTQRECAGAEIETGDHQNESPLPNRVPQIGRPTGQNGESRFSSAGTSRVFSYV